MALQCIHLRVGAFCLSHPGIWPRCIGVSVYGIGRTQGRLERPCLWRGLADLFCGLWGGMLKTQKCGVLLSLCFWRTNYYARTSCLLLGKGLQFCGSVLLSKVQCTRNFVIVLLSAVTALDELLCCCSLLDGRNHQGEPGFQNFWVSI